MLFSTGCEEDEDTIQDTQLNSELYGNWYDSYGWGGYEYTMTLSSNGNFVWDRDSSSGSDSFSTSGIWWVEGNYLVLSGTGDWGKSHPYDVSGNLLVYDGQTWTKQN